MNRRTLLRNSIPSGLWVLTPDESKQFVADVLDPPGPNEALKTAASEYKKAMAKEVPSINLSHLMAILRSNRFRCQVYKGEVDTTDDEPPKGRYDPRGRCLDFLTASIQHEYGDMGSVLGSALIFTGACVALHGYDDDTQNYRDMTTRYSERKSLLRRVEKALSDARPKPD